MIKTQRAVLKNPKPTIYLVVALLVLMIVSNVISLTVMLSSDLPVQGETVANSATKYNL